MSAPTIHVFLYLKRYEKRLKAAKISEDKVNTFLAQEKPTVLVKPRDRERKNIKSNERHCLLIR